MHSNEEVDNDLINFSVDLLQLIRKKYPHDWDSDWRNDLFLVDVCNFTTLRPSECYEAYKRASLKFNSNLPPILLIALAGCYLFPGNPISIHEAEKLVMAALEKEKSIEAVVLIRGICKMQEREQEFNYWDKILTELEKKERI